MSWCESRCVCRICLHARTAVREGTHPAIWIADSQVEFRTRGKPSQAPTSRPSRCGSKAQPASTRRPCLEVPQEQNLIDEAVDKVQMLVLKTYAEAEGFRIHQNTNMVHQLLLFVRTTSGQRYGIIVSEIRLLIQGGFDFDVIWNICRTAKTC